MKTLHRIPNPNLEVFFKGPSLEKGPLPALFYFSISAVESLSLGPFCHFVDFFEHAAKKPCRIFSITLPFHEENYAKEQAIAHWAASIKEGLDPLSPFIENLKTLIKELCDNHIIEEKKILLAGLSRGALIALLLAGILPSCCLIIGLAPLIELKSCKESEEIIDHPLMTSFSAFHHLESLAKKKIRLFIGNRDLRVLTQRSVDFVTSLAHLAHEKRIRTGSYHLFIEDSIGYLGHGTSDETFKKSAELAAKELFCDEA